MAATKSAQFPLCTSIATTQIAPAAVLLGNAAHTIYPVAAQGFNLGLHDAAALSDVLLEAYRAKKTLGHASVLQHYVSSVEKHQRAIINLTGQLTRLFELPCAGRLRGLGLLATELCTPIKNKYFSRNVSVMH